MEFQNGDVVELKSGGPKMTIASVKQERAVCVWFNQREDFHEEKTGEFLLVTLQKSAPSPGQMTGPANAAV